MSSGEFFCVKYKIKNINYQKNNYENKLSISKDYLHSNRGKYFMRIRGSAKSWWITRINR